MAIVDISAGAELTLPDTGGRYISAHIVNADHYTNAVLHDPGMHRLTTDQYDTDYVQVSIRILADPNDPDDMATVHGLQDAVEVSAGSAVPFTHPDYDTAQYDRLYKLILELGDFSSDASSRVRAERRGRSDPAPDQHRDRLGWSAEPRDHLPQRHRPPLGRPLPAPPARGASRCVLVDEHLQP